MKQTLIIFLLFFVIACESRVESSDHIKQLDSLNLVVDTILFMNLEDTFCLLGIQNARNDIANKNYKLISVGIASAGTEFTKVMQEDYNILIESIGCVVDGSEFCYNIIMDSIITNKFGNDIFFLAAQKADSLAILNSKLTGQGSSFYKIDNFPEFIGGEEQYLLFLKQNLKYPDSAIKDSIQGLVFVQFNVDNGGNISEVSILKGLSPDIDKECLRIMKSMPNWEPAKFNGKNVSFRNTKPIKFAISNNKVN